MKYTIPGRPVTKKNSQRIVTVRGHLVILPSRQYTEWEREAGYYLRPKPAAPITDAVTVRCLFYMPTRHRVDLVNLLEAACDCLVANGILADDNAGIVFSHDGSRVAYDKDNPRTEIEILREGENHA